MIKLIDGQALLDESAARLSKGEKTNFFFSEEEIFQLVKLEKISRLDYDGCVYFFVEEQDAYRLHYFLEKEKSLHPLPVLQQPVIVEEIYLEKKERMPSEESWKAIGFMPYLERKRLYLMAKNIVFEERILCFATEEMLEEIFGLMNDSFEPLTSALPTKEAFCKDIQAQKVLVSLQDEQIIGFLHFADEKQSSVLWHIAVAPNARGLGVADGLLKDWFFAKKESVKKFMLWVRIDNPPALRMYEKHGFLPDGRRAPVMIKNFK